MDTNTLFDVFGWNDLGRVRGELGNIKYQASTIQCIQRPFLLLKKREIFPCDVEEIEFYFADL